MNLPEEAIAKACCADLYQSDLARMILGDTLHPGGLALTNRLGRLMGIQPGDWVADLASGRGTSAMAVSRTFHCKVVGIEFGERAAAAALASSLEAPIQSDAFFVWGDAEQPPLKSSVIDAVLCECSMSIFPDKPSAVEQIKAVLRPKGRFGLSRDSPDQTDFPGYSSLWVALNYNYQSQGRQVWPDSLKSPACMGQPPSCQAQKPKTAGLRPSLSLGKPFCPGRPRTRHQSRRSKAD